MLVPLRKIHLGHTRYTVRMFEFGTTIMVEYIIRLRDTSKD